MIVDLVVACAWAAEKRVKHILLLKHRVIAGAAQLKGGAGSFVKANVEKEFGHWKNAGLEGQFRPEANTSSACRKAS